jgi:hypothetical protein
VIIRRRHTSNFTTISNTLFDDERLAADEVGVLGYLLSRPHDWEVRRSALMRRWAIGPGTMKRMVHNWMRTGWCQATKVRLPNGTFCILYDISDLPGKELSDDEIREALSLVSSEASPDGIVRVIDPDEPPSISERPPPCQPGVVDHGGGEAGLAYIEGPNTESPRDESDQKAERELARAREKHALSLAEFKRRYPTAASDDQGKIDAAWFGMQFDEGDAALAGIPAFLEKLKRDKRTIVPPAWKYLGEKRWTLLEPTVTAEIATGGYDLKSTEGRAICVLHDIAGLSQFLRGVLIRGNAVYYRKVVTPRLRALAEAMPRAQWVTLNRQQAAAWEGLLRDATNVQTRRPMREGDHAPWPWPPSLDGKVYTATAPPGGELGDEKLANFK